MFQSFWELKVHVYSQLCTEGFVDGTRFEKFCHTDFQYEASFFEKIDFLRFFLRNPSKIGQNPFKNTDPSDLKMRFFPAAPSAPPHFWHYVRW